MIDRTRRSATVLLGAGNGLFDAGYSIDDLNRLFRAQEGNWNGSSIDNQTRDEQWRDAAPNAMLTQTGNWERYRLNLNSDADFTDAGELDEDRTHNIANELTGRDTDDNGTDNYTLTYDANGNLTDDGKDYEYVYDAFGRLRQAKRTDNQAVVAAYRSNGLGFRISYTYDTDHDGDVDGSDQVYYWCYDEQWRIVATFRGSDANLKERFVHHAAGLGGYGGSSYIDAVILRDKDANTAWTSAADSTMEQRRYYGQNWRADVSALVTEAGKLVEWIKYSSYGVPHALPTGDTDSDGDWDATDSAAITGSYDIRKDANLDDSISAADVTHANAITGGYQTLGRGKLSSTGVASRRGYAGCEYDSVFSGTGRHFWHQRSVLFCSDLGRLNSRFTLNSIVYPNIYTSLPNATTCAGDSCLSCFLYVVIFGGACCNGVPYDPSDACCENGNVTLKDHLWICQRPLGNAPGLWPFEPFFIPPMLSFTHSYVCCDGPHQNCYGKQPSTPTNWSSPSCTIACEWLVMQNWPCEDVRVCPGIKKKKCAYYSLPNESYHLLFNNCHMWAWSEVDCHTLSYD